MIAIIPARLGSKSVPKKNIVDCAGHPLIAYAIAAAHLCKSISRVIVSTESREIADIAQKYGADVPFIRPTKYSSDTSTDIGFLNHFFENIDASEVALIRPTTPLRDIKFMNKAITTYYSKINEISSLRSVQEINETPYKVYKMTDKNICEGFFPDFEGVKNYTNLPRQTFPKTFIANGHIDILKRKNLLKKTVFGDTIYGLSGEFVIDIDSYENLNYTLYNLNTKGHYLLDFLNSKFK